MKIEAMMILEREDLIQPEKPFDQIIIHDIKAEYHHIERTGLILFIDQDGKTKILKNRHGDKGDSETTDLKLYIEKLKATHLNAFKLLKKYVDAVINEHTS